ncbi:MAG: hypothetical protein WBG73_03635 [Coleofasciculaceae cyanobacterium]
MKPNFDEMSVPELRVYVLAHRDDHEAIRALFHHPSLKWKTMPPLVTTDGLPIEENIRIAEDAIRQRARGKQREKELQREDEEKLSQKIEQQQANFRKDNMTTVTSEEIEQYRSKFADYPEALDALDLIEENEGDLEIAANLLAQEAGVVIVRSKPSFLDDLAEKLRNVICDEVFINDLMGGVLTAGVGYLTASGQIPTAMATALVIYLSKIGVRKFCQSDDGKPKTP